jgi:hypothetical protein
VVIGEHSCLQRLDVPVYSNFHSLAYRRVRDYLTRFLFDWLECARAHRVMPVREEMKMSKATVWTVTYLDRMDVGSTQDSLCYCIVRDRASLEARIIALTAEGTQFQVNEGEPVVVTVDTSPRITIGGTPTPAKKERARRRTRAEMADARAQADAQKAKANGTTAVVS